MKKTELINNKWYWIEYKKKNKKDTYIGPALYKKSDFILYEDGNNTKEIFPFVTREHNRIYFAEEDIIKECKCPPSYQELLKKCGLKIEGFK